MFFQFYKNRRQDGKRTLKQRLSENRKPIFSFAPNTTVSRASTLSLLALVVLPRVKKFCLLAKNPSFFQKLPKKEGKTKLSFPGCHSEHNKIYLQSLRAEDRESGEGLRHLEGGRGGSGPQAWSSRLSSRSNCSTFLRSVVIHGAVMRMSQCCGRRGVRVSMKDTPRHMLTPSNL